METLVPNDLWNLNGLRDRFSMCTHSKWILPWQVSLRKVLPNILNCKSEFKKIWVTIFLSCNWCSWWTEQVKLKLKDLIKPWAIFSRHRTSRRVGDCSMIQRQSTISSLWIRDASIRIYDWLPAAVGQLTLLSFGWRSPDFLWFLYVFAGGRLSAILQKLEVPVIGIHECHESMVSAFNINEKQLCAGYPEGKRDACQVKILLIQNYNIHSLTNHITAGLIASTYRDITSTAYLFPFLSFAMIDMNSNAIWCKFFICWKIWAERSRYTVDVRLEGYWRWDLSYCVQILLAIIRLCSWQTTNLCPFKFTIETLLTVKSPV
jgi:hypothetical protein